MIEVLPFKGVRPVKDKAALVATRPIKDYEEAILKHKLETNPYTFLHIINPEYGALNNVFLEAKDKFKLIKEKYNDFKEQGILFKDVRESMYLYKQSSYLGSFVGIIACTSTKDYIEGKIKIHENTLKKREKMFTNYLSVCQFNAEPVLMTYKDNQELNIFFQKVIQRHSEYDFTTTDTIRHQLWLIDDEKEIHFVSNIFSSMDSLYIADGHHRSASSARLFKKTQSIKNKYLLSYLLPDNQLVIKPFYRGLKTINKLSENQILSEIQKHFELIETDFLDQDISNNIFGLFFRKKKYLIKFKHTKEISTQPLLNQLNVNILYNYVLNPIFGIEDVRNDKNIEYIEGDVGHKNVEVLVKRGKLEVLFVTAEITMAKLKEVADESLVMPPKSTYILPKLRNGLIIYDFS